MDIDDVLQDIGCGRFHIRILLSIIPATWCIIMMFLSPSFLLPAISCYWNLTKVQSSLVMSGLFVGMYIGAPLFGRLSDKYGRMKLFRISFICMAYFTFLLVFTPRVEIFVILYTIVGIFLNGAVVCMKTYLCEIFPTKNREVGIMIYSIFAATGAVIASLCSYNIMSQYGWRYFLLACLTPGLVALLTLAWAPESPRYLLLKGQEDKCAAVLISIAQMNNCHCYDVSNLRSRSKNGKTSINELLTKRYFLLLMGVSFICLNIGFSYYGIAVLSNFMDHFSNVCQNSKLNKTIETNLERIYDTSCCQPITEESYTASMVSSSAEVPVLLIMWLVSKYFGRKVIFLICNASLVITMLSLNFCLPPYVAMTFLFVARGVASGLRAFNALYGNEVFPTSIRSMGFGISSCFLRVGIIISLFVVVSSVDTDEILIITLVFCVVNTVAGIITLFLPETKDKKMLQTTGDDTRLLLYNKLS